MYIMFYTGIGNVIGEHPRTCGLPKKLRARDLRRVQDWARHTKHHRRQRFCRGPKNSKNVKHSLAVGTHSLTVQSEKGPSEACRCCGGFSCQSGGGFSRPSNAKSRQPTLNFLRPIYSAIVAVATTFSNKSITEQLLRGIMIFLIFIPSVAGVPVDADLSSMKKGVGCAIAATAAAGFAVATNMAGANAAANPSTPKRVVKNPYKKHTKSIAVNSDRSNTNAAKATRKRNETKDQKLERIRKSNETKARQKEKRATKENEEKKKSEEQARVNFFNPRGQASVGVWPSGITGEEPVNEKLSADDIGVANNASTATQNNDRIAIEENDEDEVVVMEHPLLTTDVDSMDVVENLDFDEEEAIHEKSDDCPDNLLPGIQQRYIEAVQKRVKQEVSKDNASINQWLVNHLNDNDWWIRKVHVPWIIRRLNESDNSLKLKRQNAAYYRDVYVWLPDFRWKDKVNGTFMPCCPNCETNHRVGPHCFRDNHFGRVIVGLEETYYVISRRYKCLECERAAQQAKEQLERLAEENNIKVNIGDVDVDKYTFMGWDQRILPLYPYGYGEKFPAFLTWRAGVDKKIVNMIRPLFDGGFRPERLSKLLLEMHSNKFTDECLSHEYEIKRR